MQDSISSKRHRDRRPRIVVFGAGITGLSAAHELVERGFDVQVIEPTPHHKEEYGVQVGGIAANQQGVVKADIPMLHPYLYPAENQRYFKQIEGYRPNGNGRPVAGARIVDDDTVEFLKLLEEVNDENKLEGFRQILRTIRQTPMQRSRHRINLTEVLHFEGLADHEDEVEILKRCLGELAIPTESDRQEVAGYQDAFAGHMDDNGVANRVKLNSLTQKIGRSIARRASRLVADVDAASRFLGLEDKEELLNVLKEHPKLARIAIRREILTVKVRGHANVNDRSLELLRARYVRKLLSAMLAAYLPMLANGESTEEPLAQEASASVEPPKGLVESVANAPQDIHKRLEAALDELVDGPGAMAEDGIERHMIALSIGADEVSRTGRLRRDSIDCVDFSVLEVPLPGEHGYRYFPSYYRHIFNTMKRTPILDEHGDETIETTFDRLVTPGSVKISIQDRRESRRHSSPPGAKASKLIDIKRRHFRSFKELYETTVSLTERLGIESRDLAIFMLRIFTFLTASKERRRMWADRSWIEFLDDPTHTSADTSGSANERPAGKSPLSESFRDFHKELAIALLSMTAEEADAHSYGLNAVQLLLDYRGDGSGVDMTLNGPTSSVWLQPWKEYLRNQGVDFFLGEIVGLKAEGKDLVPIVARDTASLDERTGNDGHSSRKLENYVDRAKRLMAEVEESTHGVASRPLAERPGVEPFVAENEEGLKPDFYVLALPFEQAGRIAWEFDANNSGFLEGDLAQLAEMDRKTIQRGSDGYDPVQHRPDEERDGKPHRDRQTGKPTLDNYPLRDLSGIQFFFPNSVRFGRGHIIHAGTPWGLTSIAQATHWRNRLSREEGFLGQLSVDIGDFYREHIGFTDPFPETLGGDDAILDEIADYYGLNGIEWPFGLIRRWDVVRELLRGQTAWNSKWWEIPSRVWAQVISTGSALGGLTRATSLDPPAYYHMDEGIVFDERDGRVGEFFPVENRTPFLINLKKQWNERPGQVRDESADERRKMLRSIIEKFDRQQQAAAEAFAQLGENGWKRTEGWTSALKGLSEAHAEKMAVSSCKPGAIEYTVSNKRWVLAGTYMATHTRLMTMEACNESARHAVNTILDAIHNDAHPRVNDREVPGAALYNSSGRQMGEPCEIFDPFDYEVDDFQPLKELDAKLVEEGLPHFVDILGITKVIEEMPSGTIDKVEKAIRDSSEHLVGISKLSNAIRGLYDPNGSDGADRRYETLFPYPGAFGGDYIRSEIERALKPLQVVEDLAPLINKILDTLGKPGG